MELRGMDTIRVNGPSDPSPTLADIVVTHKATKRFVSAADGQYVLTVSGLLSLIPGGASGTFDRFRIIKVSVFGAAAGDSFVSARGAVGSGTPAVYTSDDFKFLDYGTQGSRRPAIHFAPNFEIRNTWVSVTNTSGELFIFSTLPDAELILQITMQLRTTPQASN
jgi:hypothetical protein